MAKAFITQEYLSADKQSQLRILSVANALFELRNCSGFEELCRRLRMRDLRSTFFELYAAKLFFEDGFDIWAQPETGTRGYDFDFQARRNAEAINVEVTAIRIERFSARTAKNALLQKRRQLPADLPAIVFCAFPSLWLEEKDLKGELSLICDEFFSRTQRINKVVFVYDPYITDIEDTKAAGLAFGLLTFVNPGARLTAPTLPFLHFDSREGRTFRRASRAANVSLSDVADRLEKPELFRWADSVLD